MCPRDERIAAWTQLARDLDMEKLEAMLVEVALEDVVATAPKFLEGQVRGRIVVPVAPQIA